jgi:hypothetical protein
VLSVGLENGVVIEDYPPDYNSYSMNEPSGGPYGGEYYLVPVAGTLWDIYDSGDDNPDGDGCSDQLSDDIGTTWNAIANHPNLRMETLCDLKAATTKSYRLRGLLEPLNGAYCEHGVSCSGTVAVELVGLEPGILSLEGCHPNPFRGSTRMFFWVPREPGPVRLQVFDAAGQKIKNLVDGQMGPGRYTAFWDGRDDREKLVRPGVYFVRLVSMAGTRTNKMVFLR